MDDVDSSPDIYDEAEELDFDWETEEWVLAGQALRDAIELYAGARDGDRKRAERDAIAALMRRLQAGDLWARAPKWWQSLEFHNVVPELQDELAGYRASYLEHDLLSPSFWQNLEEASRWQLEKPEVDWIWSHTEIDWVAGDFSFHMETKVEKGPMKLTVVMGRALGVCFNRTGLPTTQRIGIVTNGDGGKSHKKPPNRPRLPDALLISWWNGLSDETKVQPIDGALVPLAQASFPNHSISRERVRALDPGRKPGPKPISEE